jgi:23S rRNA pseudouridine2605 synthase
MPHIAPVGRLDAASEGLLLFTNDTKWADDILTDASHLKIYRVQVKGKPSATELSQMEKGFNVAPRVFGEKEEFMHAERAVLHSDGEKNCWLEITLSEGKNREIRRMLAHLGYEVLRLMRIQFDKFKLEDLKPGKIKIIQNSEFIIQN